MRAESLRATLLVVSGLHTGKTVVLDGRPISIGRSSKCELCLKGAGGVSRQHAVIAVDDGRWIISDAGSRNGTHVNDEEIAGRRSLKDGDVISISEERVRFSWNPPLEEPKRTPPPMPLDDLPQFQPAPSSMSGAAPRAFEVGPPTDRQDFQNLGNLQSIPPPPSGNHLVSTGLPSSESGRVAMADGPSKPSVTSTTRAHPPMLSARKKNPISTFLFGGFAGLAIALVVGLVYDHYVDDGARRDIVMTTVTDIVAELSGDGTSTADDPVGVDDPQAMGALSTDAGVAAPRDGGRVDAGARPVVVEVVPPPPPPPVAPVVVASTSAGRVAEVKVKVGDVVSKNTVLAVMQTGSSRVRKKLLDLDRARDSLESTSRKTRKVRRDLDRVNKDIRKYERKLKRSDVDAGAAGVVKKILVDVGDQPRVRAPMFEIDPTATTIP